MIMPMYDTAVIQTWGSFTPYASQKSVRREMQTTAKTITSEHLSPLELFIFLVDDNLFSLANFYLCIGVLLRRVDSVGGCDTLRRLGQWRGQGDTQRSPEATH